MAMVSPQIPSAYLGNLGHRPGPVPPGTVSWGFGSDHRRSMSSLEDTAPFYRASRVLAVLLRNPDLVYRMVMRPGECLVLDNQRVLHRWEGESDPARRLQGRYLARDWVKGQVFAGDARWNGWNRGTQELCYTYLMLLTVCKSHRQNRKS